MRRYCPPPESDVDTQGERRLEKPLLEWLERKRWLREDTIVLRELPWLGRRVDLATLGRSGCTTAFELKLGNNRRAIQQAAYNKLTFDRSYVVTESTPSEPVRDLARQVGVGIILMREGSARILQSSPKVNSKPRASKRLIGAIKSRVPWMFEASPSSTI